MGLTEEQRARRQTGIGGSDVATILGINPYKTPWELYFEKRGEIEPEEESFPARMGHRLEGPIAEEYAHQHGVKLRQRHKTFRHPEYDWLVAHIDRDVVGERKGVEIKNVGFRMEPRWGPSGTDQVADYYLPQPMHYMLVLDYPAWDVAAYIGGQEIRFYYLERDPEWDEIIIQATHDFWHHHVKAGVPPEPDFTVATNREALKRVYPGVTGEEIELPESAEHWDAVWREANDLSKQYGNVAEGAKAHLRYLCAEAGRGRLPSGAVWERKEVQRKGYTVEPSSYVDFRRKKNG